MIAAAARPDSRPARVAAADSDVHHGALDAVPARTVLSAVAPRQATTSEAPTPGQPPASAVQRTASDTTLPVRQPWLLAVLAIAALGAVSAASAKVVMVRRKRG